MSGTLESAMNITAIATGMTAFVVAMVVFRRRDKDHVEAFAYAVFTFMQVAMWSVEIFFWVAVVLRLTGHGVGIAP